MNPHVRLLVGWSVGPLAGPSVCHIFFLKRRELCKELICDLRLTVRFAEQVETPDLLVMVIL